MSLQQLSDRELDRLLDSWIDEGPMRASDVAVDAALARVTTTAQRAPIRAGWLSWPIARMQAFAVPTVVVAAVVALWAVLVLVRPLTVGPDQSPPAVGSPDATPSATQIPSLSTGSTRIEVTGATTFTEEWGFIQAPAIERYPGLRTYEFYEFAMTPCQCPGGSYLAIHLDPDDPGAYPLGVATPTSPRLIMRFGFVDDVYVEDDYVNGHLSTDAECAVTFTRFTEREVDASFECVDVPSEINEQLINIVGDFSFDPRALGVAPTPAPDDGATSGGVDIELTRSTRPTMQVPWQYGGCVEFLDGTNNCRFSDGFHRLEIWGILESGIDLRAATSSDKLRVLIYFVDSTRGEIGSYESTAGECRFSFETFTPTAAEGTIDCVDVPGESQLTYDDPAIAGAVDLRGSLAFNPSLPGGDY